MVDRSKEDLDPTFGPLVVRVRFSVERLRKYRVTPIIRPGKSELEAYVMGGGFPAMSQAQSIAGPRIIATPILAQPL